MSEEKEKDLTELTKEAFNDELNKYLEKQQQDKGSTSKNAMEEDKKESPKPYTIEELKKLSETEKEKAIEKVEESRIDEELKEKYKALQGMATKRQQYLAEKEKEMDKKLVEYQDVLNDLTTLETSLKEKVKELIELDPELAELLEKVESKKGKMEKYNKDIADKNWQEAELKVRQDFPDFGIYSEQEMTETLKKNPRLLELAQVNNGEFGDVVLAATHILTMLNENNFKKMIAYELENKSEKYQDIIDKVIGKKIEELEKKNEKKKNYSKLTESKEVKEAVSPQNKGKVSDYKHSFKDEFINLMNNPDLLEEIKSKMNRGG